MRYKLTLRSKQEIVLEGSQYSKIQDAILRQRNEMIVVDGNVFNTKDVKSVTPYSDDTGDKVKKGMSGREAMKLDFLRQEEEYRNESAQEKANRDYYTRFMGTVLASYGLKKIFGADYVSPASTKKAFDEGWDFTEEQRVDRRRRFDRWVEKSNWPTLWGSDLKSFLLEYFEQNPSKSWCDLEEWWPIFVEGKLSATKFDKILIAHERQTQNV